jgi:hypothetical protein
MEVIQDHVHWQVLGTSGVQTLDSTTRIFNISSEIHGQNLLYYEIISYVFVSSLTVKQDNYFSFHQLLSWFDTFKYLYGLSFLINQNRRGEIVQSMQVRTFLSKQTIMPSYLDYDVNVWWSEVVGKVQWWLHQQSRFLLCFNFNLKNMPSIMVYNLMHIHYFHIHEK